MLHQFRLIRKTHALPGMIESMPRLAVLMLEPVNNKTYGYGFYDSLFGHELAHCVEIANRGQIERLKLENFGWPVNKVGWFTPGAATAECKVFAIQYLLEELFIGKMDRCGGLCIDMVDPFIRFDRTWVDLAGRRVWLAEKGPKQRIEEYMAQYRPNIRQMLDTTTNYIVDNCAELV